MMLCGLVVMTSGMSVVLGSGSMMLGCFFWHGLCLLRERLPRSNAPASCSFLSQSWARGRDD